MSKVSFKYSLTGKFVEQIDEMSIGDFRRIYKEDCEALNKLLSIVDIFLTEYGEYSSCVSEGIGKIYGGMNVLWGEKEFHSGVGREHSEKGVQNIEIPKHAHRVQRSLIEIANVVRRSQEKINDL